MVLPEDVSSSEELETAGIRSFGAVGLATKGHREMNRCVRTRTPASSLGEDR